MSTIPSLALIPSGVKASKVYSVLPTNGSGDFVFKRGGNYTDSGNGTRVNKDGLLELVSANVPRLNYPLIDGVVQDCPSLLLEPLSTNQITYSEDFTLASDWTTFNATVLANQIISPDGTKNAQTFKASSSSFGGILRTNCNFFSQYLYTLSFFVKKKNHRYIGLRLSNVVTDKYNFFDFDTETVNNGLVHNATLDFEKFPNGWYRLSYTSTVVGTNTIVDLAITSSDGSTQSPIGTEEVYIYGAQLEFNINSPNSPTSYIPSLGGSTTTRFSESAKNSGTTNIYNDSEGVLYLEVENINKDPRFYRTVCINNGGASNNRVSINYLNGYIRANVKVNDTTQFQSSKLIDPNTKHKIAVKYKNNDFGFYVDGEIIETQNFGYTFTENTLSKIDFDEGKGTFVANPFYGNVNDLRYYETALTDLQLQELTTL
jgi:hypothetical protein